MEDARRAEVWSVRWKQNGDGRFAPKGQTRYFLFQPSLPLIQATLVRGAFVFIARVRPALSLDQQPRYKSQKHMHIAPCA